MSTVREQIQNSYANYAKTLARIGMIETVAEDLGLAEMEFYLEYRTEDTDYRTWQDRGPYIKLQPHHVPGLTAAYQLVDTTPTLADAARVLMPKVGRLEKSFDEDKNKIRLTGVYNGVRVILEDTPPSTCTVEKIEEEVEVPEQVIEAHTEKKVRYVLKGDCDPLMAREQVADATGVPA